MKLIYKILEKIGRWVTFIIILTVLFSITGMALAVTNSSDPLSVSGNMEVILPLAFLGQLLLLAGYVGRSLAVQKNTNKAVESLGLKHDDVKEEIGDLKSGVSTLENTTIDHGKRIVRLENTQMKKT